jgi:hypothetical protein
MPSLNDRLGPYGVVFELVVGQSSSFSFGIRYIFETAVGGEFVGGLSDLEFAN